MEVKQKALNLLASEPVNWFWMLAFLGLVSPGIISYAPYTLMWDESFYAHRIICMSREFSSGNLAGMATCLAGTHKSPALQLVGLLWGPAGSSEVGVGLAFVGLALFHFVFVMLTYRVCVRAGFAPWHLAMAAACIGLTPLVQQYGGAMLADTLLAWCTGLTAMLIALEFRTRDAGGLASFARGALWAFAIMAGSLIKLTFGFWAVAIVPILFYARWRRCGRRALGLAILGMLVFSIPGLLVWGFYGASMVSFAQIAASGEIAALWGIPGMNAGGYLWHYFSALGPALIPLAVLLGLFLRGGRTEKERVLPVAVVLGYLLLIAFGQNREARFALPVAVVLPLALCWTTPRTDRAVGRLKTELFLGGLLAGLLLAIPMVARPRLAPIRDAGALLSDLSSGRPATVVIATDGPEYNIETFQLARQLGGNVLQPVFLDTLVYDAINKRAIEDGYQRMENADYVLFLNAGLPGGPEWSRQWAAEYRTFAEQHGVLLPSETSRVFAVFRMKRP